jgi:hypothetical protein
MPRGLKLADEPEVRAALLAAGWAQKIGLRPGNLWEPAIARNLLREWRRLGADAHAWAAVEGIYTARLGIGGHDDR